jgi:hypothetical protein
VRGASREVEVISRQYRAEIGKIGEKIDKVDAIMSASSEERATLRWTNA